MRRNEQVAILLDTKDTEICKGLVKEECNGKIQFKAVRI